jgi:hypothetical protein
MVSISGALKVKYATVIESKYFQKELNGEKRVFIN